MGDEEWEWKGKGRSWWWFGVFGCWAVGNGLGGRWMLVSEAHGGGEIIVAAEITGEIMRGLRDYCTAAKDYGGHAQMAEELRRPDKTGGCDS